MGRRRRGQGGNVLLYVTCGLNALHGPTGGEERTGETRVISIAIYEQVETLNYDEAHLLSLILVVFSLAALIVTYSLNGRRHVR